MPGHDVEAMRDGLSQVSAAQTIDTYLHDLAFQENSSRLKSEYRGERDNVLLRMDNELRFAYNAWHENADAERTLGHLECMQATCLERLTPVLKLKYNTCVTLLRAEVQRSSTHEPEPQAKHEPDDFCQGMDAKAGVGEGHCGCMTKLAIDFDALESLFAAGTDGIPHLTDANQRNFVYEVMNQAHDGGVKAIKALRSLPKDTRAAFETLKAVVVDAWRNVNWTVSNESLSEADPQVVTARARLTQIATLVQAIQKTLNVLASKRDEESLLALFERCTDKLGKPSANSPRAAYAILDAMRRQAWAYLHKRYENGQSRPTLNAIVSTLDGFVSTASAALEALDPQTPDKAQALANHASIHRAVDRIRERQAERQRQEDAAQDAEHPVLSLLPAERPAPRVQGGAPHLEHQHAQICALLAQLERASLQ
jgi:hypothetical protein